ncbi:MAG: hypothetical protein AB7K86_23395 [Rhodospirillales bacterium]
MPLWLVLLLSIAAFLGANALGRALAARPRFRSVENVSTIHDAIVGLLSLITAFTFAMSLERYDARRQAVIDEANAIGTAALRARLLPSPHDGTSLKLLHDYTMARVVISGSIPTARELAAAIERSNGIQEKLWLEAKAVAARDNGFVPTGLYIQALNQMIDVQLARVANFRNRVPGIVMVTLYGIAFVVAGFSGYAIGLQSRRARVPAGTLSVLIAILLVLILDIDRPGEGYVRVSQQPMTDTASSIAAYKD